MNDSRAPNPTRQRDGEAGACPYEGELVPAIALDQERHQDGDDEGRLQAFPQSDEKAGEHVKSPK
ncbi:hypothetical protein GCM10020219_096090 [Nonomuraea dietziae]